jgi:hypothetical protein
MAKSYAQLPEKQWFDDFSFIFEGEEAKQHNGWDDRARGRRCWNDKKLASRSGRFRC